MPSDKFTAVWVSHTSMTDFLQCPRAYYLKNVYKDRTSGNKIQIVSPSLSLGSAVHEVIEALSIIPTEKRFDESLVLSFDRAWEKFAGKKGGFTNLEDEFRFKERGKVMLRRVMDKPGPLANLSIKLKQEVPNYWLSESEGLILCGKVDWIEYLKEIDSVHILDFKTSKKEESDESMQLPIYNLLVKNCQKRPVVKASYWYLEFDNSPQEKELPDIVTAEKKILEVARKMKLTRKLEKYECPNGADGCFACSPLERVLKGEGEYVGVSGHRDTYFLEYKNNTEEEDTEDSFII